MLITAEWDVQLPSPVVAKRSEKTPPLLSTIIDGYTVNVELLEPLDVKVKSGKERRWTVPYEVLRLRVSQYQSEALPPPEALESGGWTLAKRRKYFARLSTGYFAIAERALDGAWSFFKYVLWVPRLMSIPRLDSPRWLDEREKPIDPGEIHIALAAVPGLQGELSSRPWTGKDDKLFRKHLGAPPTIPLVAQLRYEAQCAISEQEVRRAILFLAIAVEVAIKSSFFGGSSTPSKVFEFLADKQRVSIRTLDMVGSMAEEVLSCSFKDDEPVAFTQLELLFRARNRVAHRGDASYKDLKGKLREVDVKTLHRWWTAVGALLEWLQQKVK